MRARAGPLLRRSVLGRLARDLQATGARRRTDVVKLARLAVDGGVDVEEDVLIRATSVSYHSGDLVLSARIGRRTFEQTRSFVAGWDLINCLTGTGDLGECEEHLAAWAPTAPGPSGRLGVAMADAHVAFWLAGDAARAEAVYDGAVAEVPTDEPDPPIPTITRAELIVDRALTAAMAGQPDDALALAEPLLDGQPAQVVIQPPTPPPTPCGLMAVRSGPSRSSTMPTRPTAPSGRRRSASASASSSGAGAGPRLPRPARRRPRRRDHDRTGHDQRVVPGAGAVGGRRRRRHVGTVAQRAGGDRTGGGDDRGRRPLRRRDPLVAGRARPGPRQHRRSRRRRGRPGRVDADRHPARTLDLCAQLAHARLLRGRGFPEQARGVAAGDRAQPRARHGVNDEFFASYELVRLDRAEEVADRLDELAAETDGPLYGMMASQARGGRRPRPGRPRRRRRRPRRGRLRALRERGGRAHRRGGRPSPSPRLATRWRHRSAELRQGCEGEVPVTVIPQGTGRDHTDLEREITLLAAQGISSKQIASRLFISSRTVDNHLAKVYVKLGVRTRAELAAVLGDGAIAV